MDEEGPDLQLSLRDATAAVSAKSGLNPALPQWDCKTSISFEDE